MCGGAAAPRAPYIPRTRPRACTYNKLVPANTHTPAPPPPPTHYSPPLRRGSARRRRAAWRRPAHTTTRLAGRWGGRASVEVDGRQVARGAGAVHDDDGFVFSECSEISVPHSLSSLFVAQPTHPPTPAIFTIHLTRTTKATLARRRSPAPTKSPLSSPPRAVPDSSAASLAGGDWHSLVQLRSLDALKEFLAAN